MNHHHIPTAVVVVPAYKAHLSDEEALALDNCIRVLGGGHHIEIVCPGGMDLTEYRGLDAYEISLDWFRDRKSYSNLCKNKLFYEHYLDGGYDYMLLHQLDAWVFSDRLDNFCALGYDYIGAPHCGWMPKGLLVGNGGFSLRKIRRFAWLCGCADFATLRWEEDRAFTEGRISKYLDIAPVDVAFRFAIQDHYTEGMEYTGGALPFGTHQAAVFWPREALRMHAPELAELIYK